MAEISNETLSHFLKSYFKENKIKSVLKFVAKLKEISPETTLSQNAIHGIFDGTRKPTDKTLIKISSIIFNNKEATLEDLEKLIKPVGSDELKIGTGFTTWSSYILSYLYTLNKNDPKNEIYTEGIKCCFCSKGPEMEPDWISDYEDIDKLRKGKLEDRYKFIADDLNKLLNNKTIDCALLLRRTFDDMKFPALTEPPILVSRILVGNGTHMYLIKKEEKEIHKDDFTKIPIQNQYVSLKNARDIVEQKDKFIELVEKKKVRTIYIGNKTIEKDRLKFLEDRYISDSLNSSPEAINIGNTKDYNNHLERIKAEFESDKLDVLIVIAFAPFNNIIYHELAKKVTNFRLTYCNYNLSKIVEDKSSYNLYATVESLKNPNKLKKIHFFLNEIDKHIKSKSDNLTNTERLIIDISDNLSDLYYPNNKTDRTRENFSKKSRMRDDLEELEYSNQSLQILNLLLQVTEKNKY